jgi:hypothetical protein
LTKGGLTQPHGKARGSEQHDEREHRYETAA